MSVIRGTFSDTYGVFCMTMNSWCIRGSSRHRHGYCHRRNALPKRLPRRRDGDDAHDGPLRAYSRRELRLYFVGSLTPSTKPDEPDAQSKESLTYAIFEASSGVGFV
jgi:hypothetical protein